MGDILDMLKKNEEIARKFLEVEAVLNSADTPANLMETLLRQLEREFNIPYVWFTLVQRPVGDELLPNLVMAEILREQVAILDEASFSEFFPQEGIPVLANENLHPFYKLFPKTRKFFLKSNAMVPLFLRGGLIGSLNLGDAAPERYYPGMDTSLLQQLAGKISECLERMAPPPEK